jgi:uncharacterized small protein (DUF1192 family)
LKEHVDRVIAERTKKNDLRMATRSWYRHFGGPIKDEK